MKITELIESYYLEISSSLKPLSVAKIKNVVKVHILPFFSSSDIPLSVNDINSWKAWILEKKLSDTYNRSIFVTLSTIFNFAYRVYDIPNVMHRCKNFKRTSAPFKANIYTLEQFSVFCSNITNLEHLVFFNILYFCGLRRGETLALTWDDVYDDHIIVNKTLSKGVLGTPKTLNSYREIFIPKFIYGLLRKLHEKTKRKFLFKLKEATIDRLNRKYAQLANLHRIRIHDFRHSHITYLMYSDISLMAICQRSGHKDRTMVLNRYSHLISSEQRKVIEQIQKDYEKNIKKNNP